MPHDLLHGYAAAALESASSAARLPEVARDLETFAAVLTGSQPLRRTLSDSLVPSLTRRAIVSDLLAERAAPETKALIDFALRVVRPSELPLAIAHLDSFAASLLEGVEELPVTGRAAVRARVRGYAERVLEEVDLAEIDEIEDELFRFARLVESNPPLRRLLGDPTAPLVGRQHVLEDLLGQKVRPVTLRLVLYVLRAGVTRDLVGLFEWLADLAAEERGRRIAQVRSAVELSEEERSRLAAALSPLVHRQVEVRTIEDPSVLGGVLISIGDLLIDGTVRLRFERLRDTLAQWT